MTYKAIQLPYKLNGEEDRQSLALKIQKNMADIEFYLNQLQVYENNTGVPLNDIVDANNVAWSGATTNFNSRNDRNGAAIVTPVIASDGTAIDHTINTDGSCNISFEWAWAGTNVDIDGFLIYIHPSTSNAAYTFGTTPADEQVYALPSDRRAVIIQGVAANLYYTFGVLAYRVVDHDINANEVIFSAFVKPTLTAENPYRPSANVAFAGDITGTINGTSAATVVTNAANGNSAWGKFSGAGDTLPAGNVEFNFATSSSKGGNATNTDNVGTQAAATVQNATINFNTRNDRNGAAVVTPTIATDATAVDHSLNTDGSSNISFEWLWTGDNVDIDSWIVYMYQSTSSAAYTFGTTPADEKIYYVTPEKRTFLMYGCPTDQYYTFGIQAIRIVDPDINANGVIKSSIVKPSLAEENPYRPSATVDFKGDVSGTINTVASSTVVSNANDGLSAYTGTTKYRTAGAPTNNPAPSGIVITSNTNATINIKLEWSAYTQGTKQADMLLLFWRKDGTAPTVDDACVSFNVNTANPSYYVFEGVNPADTYSFGLASARRTESGLEIGTIQAPASAPDWLGVTSGTPNFTGNVNGVAASTITTVATNFNARNDRKSTTPANPTILDDGTAVDHAINTDGSADISLEWGFTGSGDAYDIDGFLIYIYADTASSAYTFGTTPASEQIYNIPSEKRAFILHGVAANKYYTFGVQAYRVVDPDVNAAGVIKSAIVKPALAAENPYRPSSSVAFGGNIIGTVDGVAVTNITITNNLLNNVVANERLGAQIVGYKRTSIAYKQDGTQVLANLPRYETGRFAQALMIEEGTTNELTNPSFETDLSSWDNVGSNHPTSVRDTAEKYIGSASAKITFAGANSLFGQNMVSKKASISGVAVTFTAWVKTSATNIRLEIQSNFSSRPQVVSSYHPGNGLWQRLSVTTTITFDQGGTTTYIYFAIAGQTASTIAYYDGALVEQKPYATSFIDTTRSAETCVIPTAGVFTKSNWAVEMTFTPKTNDIASKYEVLWRTYIDANNIYSLLVNITTGYLFCSVASGGVVYSITGTEALTVGGQYSIMFSGNGSYIRLCVNGVQIGSDLAYTEPVGALPTLMYIGSNQAETNQCNGLIDDLRFSSRARTLAEHQAGYNSGVPLPIDDFTTLKQDFNNTLRQTTRQHTSKEQGNFMVADASTTQDKTKATHIVPPGWTSAQVVVNQAISELPSTGGKIVLMDGTGVVDGSIIVPSNVELDLTTMTLKVKDALNVDLNVFVNSDVTNGNSNIKISGGNIDGNKANNSAGAQYGCQFTKVTSSNINNISAQNCRNGGIYLAAGCNNNKITNNTCSNNGLSGTGSHGITIAGSFNTVIGNTCNGNRGNGIFITAPNNTITGNVCQSNYASGIYSDASGGNGARNIINSNICNSNTYVGIAVMQDGLFGYSTINGNNCQNNTGEGIYIGASNNNTVSGNVCMANGNANIILDGNSDYNNVQNNTCRHGGVSSYGIRIATPTENANVVTNNDLYNGGTSANLSDSGTGTITTAGNRT